MFINLSFLWFFGGCFFGVGMTGILLYVVYQVSKRRNVGK